MRRPIQSIGDVTKFQLCSGCGLCAYVEPDRFRMGDANEFGRRPFLKDNPKNETGDALAVCPGAALRHTYDRQKPGYIGTLGDGWGPVRAVYEGFAADDELRYAGSSGGAATALALYCIEAGGMLSVLHTAARDDAPHLNRTTISRSRKELINATGSRYSPASPCEGLDWIEQTQGKHVFIGKPCDVAGVQMARRRLPNLESNMGVTIAFFCAGVPSTKGTLELLKKVGVKDPRSITELRYRGKGWPGRWTVDYLDAHGVSKSAHMTYTESWGFLQKYRQWRCYVCPDHTGEFADISVGDPWYREIAEEDPGRSLIVARTRLGQNIIRAAAEAGYIILDSSEPSLLPRSQPNLLDSRGALWARLKVLQLMGAAVPEYKGFAFFSFWLKLDLRGRFRSIFGTVKRVYVKKLRKEAEIRETVDQ